MAVSDFRLCHFFTDFKDLQFFPEGSVAILTEKYLLRQREVPQLS